MNDMPHLEHNLLRNRTRLSSSGWMRFVNVDALAASVVEKWLEFHAKYRTHNVLSSGPGCPLMERCGLDIEGI